jgi:hypothetical protein
MNSLKISSIAGIVIGCIIGYFVSQALLDDYEACEQIKQENKQLRQILFEQHQRYYETQ